MRRPLRLRVTGALVAVALAAALVGSAFAYFTSPAARQRQRRGLEPEETDDHRRDGGGRRHVSLTWSAATAPGAEAVKYYVTRDGEDPGGTCAAPAVPTAATSCKDNEVAIGTHVYTVTAVWRSWSSTSATRCGHSHDRGSDPLHDRGGEPTPTVGVADNLTITAKDENEATVTTYTGSHAIVFSGASASPGNTAPTVANSSGTAVAFGSSTALTFTTGVVTVASSKNGVLKIYRAGTANIAATEGSITTPTPPTSRRRRVRRRSTPSLCSRRRPPSGAGDDLTITAQDTYGNTATAYTGSHNLVFSGAWPVPAATCRRSPTRPGTTSPSGPRRRSSSAPASPEPKTTKTAR